MPPKLPRTNRNPFVCPRCQLRARRASPPFSAASLRSTSSSSDPGPKYTRLESRSLIKLAGRDAGKFLHDLLPAKILGRPAEVATQPIYTVFLNAQGRILNDVFIYPPSTPGGEETWYIEVDAKSRDSLLQHLRKHKLRSKFQLERLDEQACSVWYVWPAAEQVMLAQLGKAGFPLVGGLDPRPGMGTRWLATPEVGSDELQDLLQDVGSEGNLQGYTIHRMLNGVAEGQDEIIATSALPMESNIEFCDGIDFHKGCYVGQELTIRTHHTGVIRKRILPCQIYDEGSPIKEDQTAQEYSPKLELPLPPASSNISKASTGKGRSVGKWLGGIGNIGLALCRLEVMTGLQLTEEGSHYDQKEQFKVAWEPAEDGKPTKEVRVKAFVPPWLKEGILGDMERRQKKSSRRKEEEEDDGVE